MNDESRKLREIIERATAAPTTTADDLPHDLDPETASLRDAWLQFGRLIELDVRSASRHVANHAGERIDVVPHAAPHRRPAWRFWLATSAASLLVAAGVAFAVHLFGAHEPQKNLPQIAGSNDPPKQPTAPVIGPPSAQLPSTQPQAVQSQPCIAESGVHLEWGDSVDDDITAVGEATIYAKQDAFAQSSGVWEIETGLDELKQEVDQGNL